MRVVNFRREAPPRGSGITAYFDLILPDVRINGMSLKINAAGEYRVYAPNLRGRCVAHIAPGLAEQATAAAVASLNGGRTPNDIDNAA